MTVMVIREVRINLSLLLGLSANDTIKCALTKKHKHCKRTISHNLRSSVSYLTFEDMGQLCLYPQTESLEYRWLFHQHYLGKHKPENNRKTLNMPQPKLTFSSGWVDILSPKFCLKALVQYQTKRCWGKLYRTKDNMQSCKAYSMVQYLTVYCKYTVIIFHSSL